MKKVRCLNNASREAYLKVGEVYEVESENSLNYFLIDVNCPGGLRRDRFEDVKPGIDTNRYAAQCIDNYDVETLLTKGVRYVVSQSSTYTDQYNVEGVKECTFSKRRFILIGLAANETPIVTKVAARDDKSLELSFFKTRANPQECACGSTKGVCPDHP
jgi:hypothetical protein